MVKFQPFDSLFFPPIHDKLRSDAEAAITALEKQCASLHTMYSRTADTISYLSEHSTVIENSCKKAAELLVQLSQDNDALVELVVSYKKTQEFMESRCHDLERRLEAVERDSNHDDMDKMKCSDVLVCIGIMVGFMGVFMGILMY